MAFFYINGVELPFPARGLIFERQQFVDSKRNALGQVVSQKIGRRQMKFSSLEWKHLTATQWRTIQNEIDKFSGELRYWDNPSGAFITRKVYWGDESAEVYKINPTTGEILEFSNCKCNLVDCGY